MEDALLLHRIQFAFTISFHYLFPQLTMGLALLIVIMKWIALRTGNETYNASARFWAKIFAINFAVGVVTGIPMEFQFGTNWARFSAFAGGVIGQTLAMEGVFAFFLESSFLGLFLFGEKKLGPKMHFFAACMVFLGSWISGYFIIATNAWMQSPVAYEVLPNGNVSLTSFWGLLLNPWILWQYTHNMIASVVTSSFVVAAVGAFYLLAHKNEEFGKTFVRIGVIAGVISSILVAFPTGDQQGKNLAFQQPVTLAAMEGLFETKEGAPLVIIGQPDMEKRKLDNPIHVPRMLSFLTYYRWGAEVKGLDAFPEENWPTNIPLLYFSYHIMVGLGTLFIALMLGATWLLKKGRLFTARGFLWMLMLAFPFPYIATTAGWTTVELGRQPWLVYGLLRTADGTSTMVSAGNTLFTLLGFAGMYFVIGMLFLFLVVKTISAGPEGAAKH
ncbi:MAG: cytochrome ubiquinol oxidase subunit I [Ignavibacteriae bacterium]|nr:cytochrome ubiquinol oxidase subunit I [Ignavibacteriota bacterium]